MSDLKQREKEYEADAIRINGDRKPKFGDLMRNPWASEGNPQRDGYFVREWRQGGKFNPGHYYEFTDKLGKFWETQAKYAFFIDTQPEATAPAQDLSAAILALPEAAPAEIAKKGIFAYYWESGFREARANAAALASSANALVAEDRVDAERTGTLYQAVQRAAGELPEGWTICLEIERDAGTVELIDPEGNRKLIDGNDGYLCQAVNEATNAAIQAQKDGHGHD